VCPEFDLSGPPIKFYQTPQTEHQSGTFYITLLLLAIMILSVDVELLNK
jgi:hypothetical protein